MLRKYMVAGMCVVLSSSLVLSACGKTEEKGAESSPAGEVNPKGVFPITNEKTTLKVMVKGSNSVENFATNEFTKWLEEKTNIHIEWEVAPNKTADEKLNITLASGDYPDVLLGFAVKPVQQALYGKDGVFLPLNDLIDKYGEYTNQMFEAEPTARDVITAPDGNIYALPMVNDCFHCSMGTKMWINQTWLDKLGLSTPQTTEEFREVLRAFKEQDPNGNGKADEIPLVGATNGPQSKIELFLMRSFIEFDGSGQFLKDGKIDVAYNKPEWKEGLKYLNSLFAEGLLSPQSFTQDRNQLKQMGENPDAQILGAVPSQNPTVFVSMESERAKDYVTIPPLEGPNGVRSANYNPYAATGNGYFVITNKAKNPEAAFRLADFLYSEEATMRGNIGRPDQEWKKADDGELGIDGNPAKWKQLSTFGNVQNVHWAQTGPSLRTSEFRLSQAADPDNPLEIILYNETKNNYEPYKMDASLVVPPMYYTNEQAEEMADITKTITDYKDEMLAKAVIGEIDIDKEWDNYVKTLEKMKLPRYLEIMQEAYDVSVFKK
ncbi:ABC transporter substrate-binding protein [Paenibacillus sp. J2TS4]|uniref:ABC transporter substrate-binding protein n=1 Tax=Paenibacillus sp. J2TS4 TaxID=2807194 RepID=UPI001B1684D5|nr:ABC transporter substrate-binding protein [Paenibacillus sp. J2TS4]GIP33252.1 ABC transporter substrate-binding protein [Paenibacillus sp. J2TS4]